MSLVLVQAALVNWIAMLALFGAVAGTAFVYLWVVRRDAWQPRRIQKRFPSSATLWAEVGWSVLSLLVFAIVGVGTVWLINLGYTRVYLDGRGLLYLVVSVEILIWLHDAWFYWTHRLLHLRSVFRHVHWVHHSFSNPSPWASFAFHPIEAFIQVAFVPVVILIVPVHPAAIGIWFVNMLVVNVLGHKGYEFLPAWFGRSWLFNVLNCSVHHNMHHRLTKWNFGIYFNIWDRIMGTNHPNYRGEFAGLIEEAPVLNASERGRGSRVGS